MYREADTGYLPAQSRASHTEKTLEVAKALTQRPFQSLSVLPSCGTTERSTKHRLIQHLVQLTAQCQATTTSHDARGHHPP